MTITLRSRSLIAFAAAACSACFDAASDRIARAVDGLYDAFRSLSAAFTALCRWLIPAADVVPALRDAAMLRASIELTRASAFVKRMVKRDAPRFEARWSMCPSI